jgi:hypothetical protein
VKLESDNEALRREIKERDVGTADSLIPHYRLAIVR